jgi:SAM-dependent methyltransferase
MHLDVVDLRSFYATPLGHLARRMLGITMARLWPDLRGQRLAGLGFATPYLSLMREGTERCLAMMPAAQGVVNWPATGPSASALVDLDMLPLPDACLDRILLVHALEVSEAPDQILDELWRVLAPGGRLMAIVPNRRGLWARMDTTPFGVGQPFSRSQLERLMRAAMFSPETWAETLYVPPLQRRILMRSAAAWEKLGSGLSLPFAGVHVIDATKQFHRRIPVRKARRAFALRPILLPQAVPTPRKAGPEP